MMASPCSVDALMMAIAASDSTAASRTRHPNQRACSMERFLIGSRLSLSLSTNGFRPKDLTASPSSNETSIVASYDHAAFVGTIFFATWYLTIAIRSLPMYKERKGLDELSNATLISVSSFSFFLISAINGKLRFIWIIACLLALRSLLICSIGWIFDLLSLPISAKNNRWVPPQWYLHICAALLLIAWLASWYWL